MLGAALEQELAALTEQLIAASDDTEAQLTLLRDTTYRSVTPHRLSVDQLAATAISYIL